MYREPITNFIAEDAIIYIPKNGGLNDYVCRLLDEVKTPKAVSVIPARGSDVPLRVEDALNAGKNAFGITGDDIFDEFCLRQKQTIPTVLSVLNTYDWCDESAQFGRPALCFMTRGKCLDELGDEINVAINSKYESTARKYLDEKIRSQGKQVRIAVYDGDTENTVAEGTNDACVEIVYRGNRSSDSAMTKMGLVIQEIVRLSDIVLIGPTPKTIWQQEYSRILDKAKNPTGSYTSKLLADQNELVKKFGSESAEFLAELISGGDNLLGEALDVVYATMLGLARTGALWDDLEAKLLERQK